MILPLIIGIFFLSIFHKILQHGDVTFEMFQYVTVTFEMLQYSVIQLTAIRV